VCSDCDTRGSTWVLEEEEGLSGDLTGHSLGRWSNGCGRAVRSGGGGGEREFLHKRNLKEDREWMWCQIVKLLMPFIGQRREDRQCHEGETTDSEWSSSMLPFLRQERKQLLVPTGRGDRMMQRHSGLWWRLESSDIWIDLRWKTINRVSWVESLFGSNIVGEIKQAAEMEWAGKEIFLWRRILVVVF
jgi:hypothetical protein